MIKLALFALGTATLVGFTYRSATLSFDMKDPKGANGLSLYIDGPLEPVVGQAGGISGNIAFDAAKPENSKGKIVVDVKTVELTSERMTEKMQEEWCLDAEKYPTIEFEVKKVSGVKKTKSGYDCTVNGTFTLKGVSKDITVKANVSYLPGQLAARGGVQGREGDLIVVRTSFSFDRTKFGVAPDLGILGNNVDVKLAAVGISLK
jgi:polyisoprenoid-binding protein YceI